MMRFIMRKIAAGSSRLHADPFIYSLLFAGRARLIFLTAKGGSTAAQGWLESCGHSDPGVGIYINRALGRDKVLVPPVTQHHWNPHSKQC